MLLQLNLAPHGVELCDPGIGSPLVDSKISDLERGRSCEVKMDEQTNWVTRAFVDNVFNLKSKVGRRRIIQETRGGFIDFAKTEPTLYRFDIVLACLAHSWH